MLVIMALSSLPFTYVLFVVRNFLACFPFPLFFRLASGPSYAVVFPKNYVGRQQTPLGGEGLVPRFLKNAGSAYCIRGVAEPRQ